ncbi:phasin family protein [Sphingobium sp. JS3065]|uniref:phasin family protein n=1 Tax=Sphingobium sp. JS3065 TaxID=2970925 RepID=UPI0022650A65|nr:phasin family protein [Sphingobium sp. JS3065]UZW54766.1 phasin family protein [Sphingobium sp. JS3065]
MAVTPKPVRKKPVAKKSSSTLSAAEALKAAEAAIKTPAKPTVKKPAPPKTPAAPPARKAVPAAKADPVAVIAATTAVDAAPEPAPVAAAPKVETPRIDPVARVAPPEPKESKSLSSKAGPPEPKSLPAIEGTKMMNDVIETGKKFAEETKAKLETVYADLNEKAKVSVEKSTKAIEEFSDIAKGNVEALVESGKIAAKGFETLGQEAVDYSKKSFEKATASFKSFSTVKTPTEFFQLQSQLFSSSFDEFTKEAAKSSEALIKLAGDVASPLTARVTVVTDKVKALAA